MKRDHHGGLADRHLSAQIEPLKVLVAWPAALADVEDDSVVVTERFLQAGVNLLLGPVRHLQVL